MCTIKLLFDIEKSNFISSLLIIQTKNKFGKNYGLIDVRFNKILYLYIDAFCKSA